MAQNDDGFTLIETLAALVILTLGASAFYSAMEMGTRGAQVAIRESSALALAQSRLDEAVALGPQTGNIQNGQTSDGYTWETTYSELSSSRDNRTAANLTRIDVRVSWRNGPASLTRDLTLTTLSSVRNP